MVAPTRPERLSPWRRRATGLLVTALLLAVARRRRRIAPAGPAPTVAAAVMAGAITAEEVAAPPAGPAATGPDGPATTLPAPLLAGAAIAVPAHGGRRGPQAVWLLVYALALVVPLLLVLVPDDAAPRTLMLELGSSLGIAALSLLALQLVLPARLPLLAAIGAEVAVRLYRRMADVMLAVVAAHVVAVMVADPSRLELLRFFGEPWRAQAAIGSVVALVVLFGTSFPRRGSTCRTRPGAASTLSWGPPPSSSPCSTRWGSGGTSSTAPRAGP